MRVHRQLGSRTAPAMLAITVLVAAAGRAEPTLTGVTSTAATVTTFPMPEVTAAVFGPGEHPKCPAGRLLLGSGGRVRSLDLDGGDAQKTEFKDFRGAAVTSFIKDNHLIRIGEDLVYSVEGYTHELFRCMSANPPASIPRGGTSSPRTRPRASSSPALAARFGSFARRTAGRPGA